MLQNQFYPQVANPYYPQPYQNFQPQQRQEQMDQLYTRPYNYNFVRDINEAKNWPTAPGNHLVFEDQNGQYFYTKSLGFGPNEKPTFAIFRRDDSVEQPLEDKTSIEQNPLKEEINTLKSDINELKELFKQSQQKPHFDKQKGGNRQ